MLYSTLRTILRRIVTRQKLLLLAGILFTQLAGAQMPVQIATQVLPPYSLRLSDYYNGTTPKLIVTATNQDLAKPVLEVRLRMTITGEGNGVKIISRDNVYYPTIYLDAGIPVRLTLNDFTAYFNADNLLFQGGITKEKYLQGGKLPEGFYSISFDAIEVASRQVVSSPSAARFWASLSDPPLLNQPVRDVVVAERNPTNIVFNWTPRHLNSPNSAFNTEYVFQVAEITDPRINPQAAFETARPLYEATTRSTSLVYGPAEPLLITGRRYAWRVRAREIIGSDDVDIFKNNGFSEVYWFSYSGKCIETPPVNVRASFQNEEILISWDGDPAYSYHIMYDSLWYRRHINYSRNQEKASANLFRIKASRGSTIHYMVGAMCPTAYNKSWDAIRSFKVPGVNTVSGRVVWAFKETEETIQDSAIALLQPDAPVRDEFVIVGNSNDKPGKQRSFPLGKASVQLYGLSKTTLDNVWIGQATAETDKDGNYQLELPNNFKLQDYKDYYLAIKPSKDASSEGMFTYIKLPPKDMNPSSYGYSLGTDTLSAQTTRFRPVIKCSNCPNAADASVDVLMKRADWNKYRPYYEAAGLGQDPDGAGKRNVVKYNNEDYLILATLTSGKSFNYLFNNRSDAEHYVVRVNYKGAPSVFYPLKSFNYPLFGSRQVAATRSYNRTFEIKAAPRIEGFITHNKAPRRDVLIEVYTMKVGYPYKTGNYSATTDAQGYYQINLPVLDSATAANTTLYIKASDWATKNFPEETRKYGGYIRQDFVFRHPPMFLLVGRVTDQHAFPVANALVTVEGTASSARTSADGFYAIKTFKTTANTIKITSDGYDPVTLTYTPRKIDADAGDEQYTAEAWASRLNNLPNVQAHLKANKLDSATADLLGIGTGKLQPLYPIYMRPGESLKDIAGIPDASMNDLDGKLQVSILMNDKPVNAWIEIWSIYNYNDIKKHPLKGADVIRLKKGSYRFRVFSKDENQLFLGVDGAFGINGNSITKIALHVKRFVKVQGTVVDSKTMQPLPNATVYVEGPQYARTIPCNQFGQFGLDMLADKELNFSIKKEDYITKDSTLTLTGNTSVTFAMQGFGGDLPKIEAIAGFPVKIERMAKATGNTYVVSGTMEVGQNDIFAPDADANKLTFKQLSVKLDEETKKFVPLADILFEEAVMKTTAFGFAPVEVLGYPSIKLRALKNKKGEYTYENGTIGGLRLKLDMSRVKDVSAIPIRLQDAILEMDDSSVVKQEGAGRDTSKGKFAYVYTPPGFIINALAATKEFKINFLASDTGRTGITLKKDSGKINPDYYKAGIGWVSSFYIRKDSSILNADGINLNGYVQFPNVAGIKVGDSGKVVIEKFIITKGFKLGQLTFRLSPQKPLIARLQKIEARVTRFSVFGLATPNVGIGVGGIILLKKDSAAATTGSTATNNTAGNPPATPKLGGATNNTGNNPAVNTASTTTGGRNDTLFIHEFNFVNKEEGITVDGKLAFGQRGIGIKSLVFSNPEGTYIGLSYNFTEKSFVIDGSGLLRYDRNRNGNGKKPASTAGQDSAMSSIFPIEIQKFEYKSKDASFLMAAKANISINLKVMKINVERFLVSVGSSASLDQMNSYLVSGTAQGGSIGTGGPDEPLDETKTSWAVGVKGGIEFIAKGISVAGAEGSLIVANINDEVKVKVNEVRIFLNQSAFKMDVKVKMAFEADRQGLEGSGEFEVMSRKLEASFFYWKMPNGFDLGCEVKADAGFVTGPIMWHSIGGGFRYNSADKIYSVKLLGDIGPAGTPKQTGYVKDAFVEVLFDANNCGAKPVVNMGGRLNLMEKDWATVTGKFDFCRNLMLITLKTEPIPIPSLPGILAKLDGTLFGLAQSNAKMLMMCVNAEITSLGDMLKGNLNFALGYDYNNNHELAPQEIKNIWSNIEAEAKDNNGTVLNGVAVTGTVAIPGKSGGFSVSIARLDLVDAKYSFGGSGGLKLFYKFSDKTFKFAARIEAYANGSVRVLGKGFNGEAKARLYLEGGYGGKSEEERSKRIQEMQVAAEKRLANPEVLDKVLTGNATSDKDHNLQTGESEFETGYTQQVDWRQFKKPVVEIENKPVAPEVSKDSFDAWNSRRNKTEWYTYSLDTKGKRRVFLEVKMLKNKIYNYQILVNDVNVTYVQKNPSGTAETFFTEFYEVDGRYTSPTNPRILVKIQKNGVEQNPIFGIILRDGNTDKAAKLDEVGPGHTGSEQVAGHNGKFEGQFQTGQVQHLYYRQFHTPSIKVDGKLISFTDAHNVLNAFRFTQGWYSYTLDTKKQKAVLQLTLSEDRPYSYSVYAGNDLLAITTRSATGGGLRFVTEKYPIPASQAGSDGKVTIKVKRQDNTFPLNTVFGMKMVADPEEWKAKEEEKIKQETARQIASDQTTKSWFLNGGASLQLAIYNENGVGCNSLDWSDWIWRVCVGFDASFKWRQGEGSSFSIGR